MGLVVGVSSRLHPTTTGHGGSRYGLHRSRLRGGDHHLLEDLGDLLGTLLEHRVGLSELIHEIADLTNLHRSLLELRADRVLTGCGISGHRVTDGRHAAAL